MHWLWCNSRSTKEYRHNAHSKEASKAIYLEQINRIRRNCSDCLVSRLHNALGWPGRVPAIEVQPIKMPCTLKEFVLAYSWGHSGLRCPGFHMENTREEHFHEMSWDVRRRDVSSTESGSQCSECRNRVSHSWLFPLPCQGLPPVFTHQCPLATQTDWRETTWLSR